MAPLSSQLLQSRRLHAAATGTASDSERHAALNATWSGMGSKHLDAAEAHGALRPRSVHEIVARARATVASPAGSPVGELLQQQQHLQQHLQQQQAPPQRLQKLAPRSAENRENQPPASGAGAAKKRPAAAAAAAASDVDDFVKRAETGALQSVQEKARARAERLVGQRDPRHGTKRKGAGKALDAAAANQQQMQQRVTKRLQERVLTELKRIENLCPADPDDVAVAAARRDETNAVPASTGGAPEAPNDVAFLESALRHLRTHHQRLTEVMKSQSAADASATRNRSRNAAPPRVAVVQPSQQQQPHKRAGATGAKPGKLEDGTVAAAGQAQGQGQHAAAARIQHQYRVRLAVRKVKAKYDGKLRASRRELHKLRKQRERDELARQKEQQQQQQQPQPQQPASGAAGSGDAATSALAAELEALRAQLSEETRRADAAEEAIVQWQQSEEDNMAQIAELREELYSMEKQARSAESRLGVQEVERDAARCESAEQQQQRTQHALPYGGDIQAAMRAQDRDAIRQIMATRSDNPPPAAATRSPGGSRAEAAEPQVEQIIHSAGAAAAAADEEGEVHDDDDDQEEEEEGLPEDVRRMLERAEQGLVGSGSG